MKRKSIWSHFRAATHCGLTDVAGFKYGSFPVRAEWSGLEGGEPWVRHAEARVVARSAADAANHWLEECCKAWPGQPVEVEAVGYKGGTVVRYAGWDRSVFLAMILERHESPAVQLEFNL